MPHRVWSGIPSWLAILLFAFGSARAQEHLTASQPRGVEDALKPAGPGTVQIEGFLGNKIDLCRRIKEKRSPM